MNGNWGYICRRLESRVSGTGALKRGFDGFRSYTFQLWQFQGPRGGARGKSFSFLED